MLVENRGEIREADGVCDASAASTLAASRARCTLDGRDGDVDMRCWVRDSHFVLENYVHSVVEWIPDSPPPPSLSDASRLS